MSLFVELKRRNVFKVGIAYVLMGWVLLQGADFALDLIDAPNWVTQVFALAVVIGLPIALFFAWAFEMTPEGIKREHEVDRSQSITHKTGRKLDFFIIGLLVLAVIYLLVDKFAVSPDATPLAEPEVAAQLESDDPESTEPAAKSIAVLPFTNMSEDAGNEFFSDGISEEILNALARVQGLKVAGRTSSFAFKGRNEDLRLIGETLGVEHILEGSVRKAGNTVRITAQLIQVEDGFHLWSDTWDRELNDVFAIQDEISAAILDALKAELVATEPVQVAKVDLAVYDQYLLARQKIRERNEEALLEAAGLLDQVIETDPAYAPAWAQRGITEMLLTDQFGSYGSIPPAESYPEGRRYLEEALRLDPDLAEGLAGMGLYYINQLQTDEAIDSLERALALNPAMTDAWNWLQQAIGFKGDFRRAHEISEQIHQRDPLYLPAVTNLSGSYLAMDEADKIFAMVERLRLFYQEGPGKRALVSAELIGLMTDDREAEAIKLSEANANIGIGGIARGLMSFAWVGLQEYEKSLEHAAGTPFAQFPLARLGRYEEARMIGYEFAAQGQGIDGLITVLYEEGRHEEIIEFVTSRWPDLDSFEATAPQRFGFGSDTLGRIAYAYRATDDQAGFDDSLSQFRAALDQQLEQGANNPFLSWSQAHYAMLAGNQEAALLHMGMAVDQGFLEHPHFTDYWHVFKPLQADPRFEGIRQRIIDRINEQRALLELEPVGTET